MLVAVTGGTGFVGSHTVAALCGAGHEVRLLARDPAKVQRALAPLGVDPGAIHVMTGDATDGAAVERLVGGADACLHAAAVVATRRADMGEVERTNVAAAHAVLDAAVAARCDPVVHVSSVSAVFPPAGSVLRADDPVTWPASVYGRSKARCEQHARELQAAGHPVVTVYPGGIAGPHDAGLNAFAGGLARFLRLGAVPVTTGGMLIVDVRDLAMVFARILEPGRGPRRYMAGGHHVAWRSMQQLLSGLTGRELRGVPTPAAALRTAGRLGDLAGRWLGLDVALDEETAYYVTGLTPSDDRAVHTELGVHWRPPRRTLADVLDWLVTEGHVDPRHAGRAPSTGR